MINLQNKTNAFKNIRNHNHSAIALCILISKTDGIGLDEVCLIHSMYTVVIHYLEMKAV